MNFLKAAVVLMSLGFATSRLFAPVVPPQPPTLVISATSTNTVVISWPDSAVAGNFRLEQKSLTATTNVWKDLTNVPVLNSGTWRVTLPATNSPVILRAKY